MTLPIERFKDAYANWRYNPFTAVDMAVDKIEDGLIIPSGSPFIIQLLEQARYNDPTSVSVRCYGVDTTVDETSASGQPILKVAATAGFSPGDNVIINRGGAREEEKIIDTIQGGISLTMTVNLEFEHTAVQADAVEKYIAFMETGGAPAQSQFRVDYPPDDGGKGTGLVAFNTNDANKEVRISYKATGSPAVAETLDTKISYPANTPGDDQFVGFSSGAPIWRDFPHVLAGGEHTASGLTVGHVIRASAAAAFAWAQLQHGDLGGISVNQHHAQAHSLASHSSKAHSELTGIGANDHHPQSHTLGSHSSKSHGVLTDVLPNQHHTQVHTLASHSTRPHSVLTDVTANQHHPQAHTLTSHSTKAHGELTGIGSGDHHAQAHRDDHYAGEIDQIAGQSLAQLRTTDSPSFAGLTIGTNVTVGSKITLGGAGLGYIEAGTYLGSAAIYNNVTASSINVSSYNAEFKYLGRNTSAKKYKDKISDLELDSSKIHKLRPVSFNSLCKGDDEKQRFHGLIADEVEKIYPEIVVYNEKHEAESYDNQMLLALLIDAFQKLKKQVTN